MISKFEMIMSKIQLVYPIFVKALSNSNFVDFYDSSPRLEKIISMFNLEREVSSSKSLLEQIKSCTEAFRNIVSFDDSNIGLIIVSKDNTIYNEISQYENERKQKKQI